MRNLNISAMDTRDSLGRERFIPFNPEKYMFLDNGKNLDAVKSFYYQNQKVRISVSVQIISSAPFIVYWFLLQTQGMNCCSDTAISVHGIDTEQMNLLELLIYQIRPYGLKGDLRPFTPEPPPDYDLTATPWIIPENTTTTATPTTTTNASNSTSTALHLKLNETLEGNKTNGTR